MLFAPSRVEGPATCTLSQEQRTIARAEFTGHRPAVTGAALAIRRQSGARWNTREARKYHAVAACKTLRDKGAPTEYAATLTKDNISKLVPSVHDIPLCVRPIEMGKTVWAFAVEVLFRRVMTKLD